MAPMSQPGDKLTFCAVSILKTAISGLVGLFEAKGTKFGSTTGSLRTVNCLEDPICWTATSSDANLSISPLGTSGIGATTTVGETATATEKNRPPTVKGNTACAARCKSTEARSRRRLQKGLEMVGRDPPANCNCGRSRTCSSHVSAEAVRLSSRLSASSGPEAGGQRYAARHGTS